MVPVNESIVLSVRVVLLLACVVAVQATGTLDVKVGAVEILVDIVDVIQHVAEVSARD